MPSAETTWKFAVPTLIGMLTAVWAGSAAFGGKADKSELDPIRKDLYNLQKERAVDSTIQSNILELLKRIDGRMEKLEDKQDYTIKEIIRNRDGSFLPGPTPAPLNR